jgi:hypothetical protein
VNISLDEQNYQQNGLKNAQFDYAVRLLGIIVNLQMCQPGKKHEYQDLQV